MNYKAYEKIIGNQHKQIAEKNYCWEMNQKILLTQLQ